MTPLPSRLLVVTDRRLAARDLGLIVDRAMSAGASWIWLRDKDMERGERLVLARRILEVSAGRAIMTMGADVELAIELGCKAVHLPMAADLRNIRERLGQHAFIGLSAHSLEDVVHAGRIGADYVTLSPIFETVSKPDYGPAFGLSILKEATALGVPVMALGGISPQRVVDVMGMGAAGVAVMGGIMREADTCAIIRTYLLELNPEITVSNP